MAHINILDYIAIGLDTRTHTATSYVVAKDKEFEKIIDSSIHNTVDLLEWTTPLPKREEDGPGYYSDLRKLYAKVKLHFGKYESPWFILDFEDQMKQNVVITEKERYDRFSKSYYLGWGYEKGMENEIPDYKTYLQNKDDLYGFVRDGIASSTLIIPEEDPLKNDLDYQLYKNDPNYIHPDGETNAEKWAKGEIPYPSWHPNYVPPIVDDNTGNNNGNNDNSSSSGNNNSSTSQNNTTIVIKNLLMSAAKQTHPESHSIDDWVNEEGGYGPINK